VDRPDALGGLGVRHPCRVNQVLVKSLKSALDSKAHQEEGPASRNGLLRVDGVDPPDRSTCHHPGGVMTSNYILVITPAG